MSKILTLKTQRELKPDIEDILPHFLDGDELENALDFIAHLRSNKMNPRWAGVHNTWNCNYKGKIICFIRFGITWHAKWKTNKIKWEISPNLININAYENEIINENMQNSIWDGLVYCKSCINSNGSMRKCSPGVNKTVLKKDIIGICGGFYDGRKPISFQNPDKTAINHIKRMLDLEKQARAETHTV